MKPISPRIHGVIDYGAVLLAFAAPSLLGLKGSARPLSYLFGAAYLGVSALTAYPLGLAREIPFPTHGKIELFSAPALLALPWLTGALKRPTERAYFATLLGTVLTVYALTDWDADPDA